MMIYASDPGLHGAVACFRRDGSLAWVRDMPTYEVTLSDGRVRNRVDAMELGLWIADQDPMEFGLEPIDAVYIENVGPSASTAGSFAFGRALGALEGVIELSVLRSKIHYVSPQTWKKHFALGRDKNESRELASKLFPEHRDLFKRAKDDGRAESVLIGQWGYEQWSEQR